MNLIKKLWVVALPAALTPAAKVMTTFAWNCKSSVNWAVSVSTALLLSLASQPVLAEFLADIYQIRSPSGVCSRTLVVESFIYVASKLYDKAGNAVDFAEAAGWDGTVKDCYYSATDETIDVGSTLLGLNSTNAYQFYNFGSINIGSNGSLDNQHGGILDNSGLLRIYFGGLLSNYSNAAYDSVTAHGGILHHDAVDSVINNNSGGMLLIYGTLNNSGVVINNAGATLVNTSSSTLNNYGGALVNGGYQENSGTLNNSGILINYANLVNKAKGTLTNSDVLITKSGGALINWGTLINSGSLSNDGILNNKAGGILINSGALKNEGTLTNYGTLNNIALVDSLWNTGTLDNWGSLKNDGTLYNDGTVNNKVGGTLINGGDLHNEGTLTNHGYLKNDGTLHNIGTLTNSGSIAGFRYDQTAGQTINNGSFSQIFIQIGGGSFTQSGGQLAVGSILNIAGIGTFNLDGGTLNLVGSSIDVDYFNIGNAAGSNGSFTLASGKSLSAFSETIGLSGTGSFTQSGGTHAVSSAFYMGLNGGSNGSYTQSGGTLTVGSIVNGAGTSNFNLDGGTLTVGSSMDVDNFTIGNAEGSNGSFTLANGKSLSANREVIGNSGTGSFTQSGGTHKVSILYLGYNSGSNGNYTLSGGSLTADSEFIGNSSALIPGLELDYLGTGSFTQSGGTHTANYLYLGYHGASKGSYTLSGGTLTVDSIDRGAGTGTFNIDGGTLSVGRSITVDYFNIGNAAGSVGSFTLASDKSLFAYNVIIGVSGTGSFTQTGGTHTVTNILTLGNDSGSTGSYTLGGGALTVGGIGNGAGTGTFNLDGGTLSLAGSSMDVDQFFIGNAAGSSGSFTLTSGKSLSANFEVVGINGTGSFTQSGGTHTVNDLYLGYNSGNNGSHTMSGGSLSASNEIIGVNGTGSFTQSGGTHTVSNALYLGYSSGSSGSYTLSGAGSLSANNEFVGLQGAGNFTQTGGSNTVGNTLTLGADTGGQGTYDLKGGTLTVSGGVTNNANSVFNVASGATATVGGTGFVNHGLLVGTGTIAGDVNSDGIVAPGNSPGSLTIDGNYTQSIGGIFNVEIGGLSAGTQHDVLNVTGIASLNGSLNVILFDLDGSVFAPHAGDYFDILTADVLQGSFSILSYASLLGPNLSWNIAYLTDAYGTTDVVRLSVTAVPEPETWLMMLAGLGLLGTMARRRQQARV